MIHPLLISVLDAVEAREMRLLSWGIVDGSLAKDELVALIDPRLDASLNEGENQFVSPDEVIEAMQRACLLHATPEGGFRSRLAEATRLLQRLRQVFADKADPRRGNWQGAPTLAADFRIARRQRRYPKRDRPLAELLESLSRAGAPSITTTAISALATSSGEALSLAGFQCRATHRILDSLRRAVQSATVVCAGTGSGKTVAFYLPVLSHLAQLAVPHESRAWVKAIALYPRNELLKDQLAEVYAQTRRLDSVQAARGARKLTVAAYFGPAPRDPSPQALERAKWKRAGDRYLCDYIRCPKGCNESMSWLDADRAAHRERLHCPACHAVVREDEVRLTRERIEREPPDVLFTTTESLNRRLSDSRARHLFGVGAVPGRTPLAVLLDEAHTYAGTHGAQVAYLLRRWRAGVRAPMAWVGLSATLRDAAHFFRDLTGLPEAEVAEVSPLFEEYEEEGAEYMIALRGDPVSRTSLLSTTIQTAMLLARVLDRRDQPRSEGIYPSRTFIFTDDIDVTNRLYFDLLDAEGRDSFGNVDTSRPTGGLAALRTPEPSDLRRYRHGQDWKLAQDIGHALSDRLVIGRTSSQDVGVDRSADVIVATASLEVGFNDPTVGAVLQHKAPRDVAQYLQRRGRAGRMRHTRPWTVVVLSDYGRDRIAYQNYQTMFDPLLPPRRLPVRNRNVLRMQAVYAAIDFLRQRVQAPGSIWAALSGPATFAGAQALQRELVTALTVLLRDSAQAEALQRHLASALQVDADELDAVLWGYPRPLLLAALPTALRRLVSQWQGPDGPGTDLVVPDNPLPDFVPGSLFDDLNLPEVAIDAPPQTRGGKPERYAMPMLQAIRQFAPGRVSRRFGIVHRRVRHWVPVPVDGASTIDLDLNVVGTFVQLGHFELGGADDQAVSIPVVQPRKIVVATPPPEVGESSNAQLVWHTQIVPPAEALRLPLTEHGGSVGALAALEVFTHQNLNPVEVRRFATASRVGLQFRDGHDESLTARFVLGAEPTAMGFSLLVDGLCFRIHDPQALWDDNATHATPKWRALRVQRYRDEIARAIRLSLIENDHLRVRLGEVFFAAICNRSCRTGTSLGEAATAVTTDASLTELNAVLDQTLQAASSDGSGHSGRQERLRTELLAALALPAVREALKVAATVLWDPVDSAWEPWLRRVYRDTLAAAIVQAVIGSCPGVDDSQLLVDTDPGPRDGYLTGVPENEVWLTETTVGGAGVVEQFVARYAADPRRFSALLDHALGASEWEQIDAQLLRLTNALQSNSIPALVDAVARFRGAERADEASATFAEVRHALTGNGFPQHHSFLSALVNRLLRPGSTPAADAFVALALRQWQALEEALGIELDLATVGPILAAGNDAEAVLDTLPPDATADVRTWRTSVVTGLLWPRGAALRSSGLGTWSPFRHAAAIERWLVTDRLRRTQPCVMLQDTDWREQVLSALGSSGSVTAVVADSRRDLAADFCAFLAAQAVESEYLFVYARIRAVRVENDRIEIDAEVAETAA